MVPRFTAKHLARKLPAKFWELESEEFWWAFSTIVWKAVNDQAGETDPLELWEDSPKAQARVRPLVADVAETAQFLAAKEVALDPVSRDMFLD
jgi:hypothetical protein